MRTMIRNFLIILHIHLDYLLNTLKVKLGILKVKYGITGYFEVDGVAFTTIFNSAERVEMCQKYDNFRPDDVVLCTYPKAGTHFTFEIISSIYEESGMGQRCPIHLLEVVTPAFTMKDFTGCKAHHDSMAKLDAMSSPRIICTHLPWAMLPPKLKEGKVKIIHCIRNPKDVLCSSFPYLKKMKVLQQEMQWKEYFMNFIKGHVLRLSYMAYMKQWYPNRNMPTMLNLQFEEMTQDLEGNVRQIAEFLGVELTDDQIRRIAVANTFENKKKEMGKGHVIYRQGKSGGWKSTFTVEQNEIMSEWIEAEMKGMEDFNLKYG